MSNWTENHPPIPKPDTNNISATRTRHHETSVRLQASTDVAHPSPDPKRIAAVDYAPHDPSGTARVTLLASPETAERLTIARIVGSVEVSVIPERRVESASRPEPLVIRDPAGRPITEDLPIGVQAVLYLKNDQTNHFARAILENGRWVEREGPSLTAF